MFFSVVPLVPCVVPQLGFVVPLVPCVVLLPRCVVPLVPCVVPLLRCGADAWAKEAAATHFPQLRPCVLQRRREPLASSGENAGPPPPPPQGWGGDRRTLGITRGGRVGQVNRQTRPHTMPSECLGATIATRTRTQQWGCSSQSATVRQESDPKFQGQVFTPLRWTFCRLRELLTRGESAASVAFAFGQLRSIAFNCIFRGFQPRSRPVTGQFGVRWRA